MAQASDETIILSPPDWSRSAGDRWANHLDTYEAMLVDAGDALLDRAALTPGLTVAEIGCGGGAVSRAVAARVAPNGLVVGVDISPSLIALCTGRSAAGGIANAKFVIADAGTVTLADAPFDRILSRFGIMFFADPPAAFGNLRAMLKPGGRADFAVWAAPAENKAISSLAIVAGTHLNLPPADPTAPGPFSLCDPARLEPLLAGAGFTAIAFDLWRGVVPMGGGVGPRGAAEFAMHSSMLADVLAEQPTDKQAAIVADLTTLFTPYDGPQGVAIPAAVWLVRARAPER